MPAYCFKCRARREIKNPQPVIQKNRRPAIKGVCPVCGTQLFRIGKGWLTVCRWCWEVCCAG